MTDSKPSGWDRTARVVLPALSLIAFIVVQLMGKQPRLSWGLIVLTVFLVALSFHSEMREQAASWKSRREDRLVVESAYPRFREFVRRFQQFINRGTSDTLHYIVASDLCQNRSDLLAYYQLPNIEIWEGMWRYFSERISRKPKTMEEFRATLMEFHFILGTYCTNCVLPIFENLPANRRSEIQPAVKEKLNLFQQKFARFVGEYHDFGNPLSESRPALQGLPVYVSIPRPMG